MSNHEITTALAAPFAWTPDGTFDLRLAFVSGMSPVNVTVPAATYKVNLAAAAADFLRVLEARINLALGGVLRAETVAVTLSDRGLVTLAMTGGSATWTFTATLRDALGLNGTGFAATATVNAVHPPDHLYLSLGGDSQGWQPVETIAGAMNEAGAVMAIRSGVRTEVDTVELEFIPTNPDLATEEQADWTPWEPGASTLPWSWRRFLDTGLARGLAFTREWQRVRTSTTEAFDLVSIPVEFFRKPDVRQQFPSWSAWRALRLPLVRTGTGARA